VKQVPKLGSEVIFLLVAFLLFFAAPWQKGIVLAQNPGTYGAVDCSLEPGDWPSTYGCVE